MNEEQYYDEHQNLRKKCWIEAWANVAGAHNCTDDKTATKWADEALKQFDERFPVPFFPSNVYPLNPFVVGVPNGSCDNPVPLGQTLHEWQKPVEPVKDVLKSGSGTGNAGISTSPAVASGDNPNARNTTIVNHETDIQTKNTPTDL